MPHHLTTAARREIDHGAVEVQFALVRLSLTNIERAEHAYERNPTLANLKALDRAREDYWVCVRKMEEAQALLLRVVA